jgi:hypothetical protein
VSYHIFEQNEHLGRIWLPNISVSRPGGPTAGSRNNNICVASIKRQGETAWASITHNARVDIGADLQFNRFLGVTTGITGLPPQYIALGNTGYTANAHGHTSIGTTGTVTTNEFTTLGLSRATGTFGTYTTPTVLDASVTILLAKTFIVSGGSGTNNGSALFDNTVASGISHMWVEALYTDGGQTAAAFIDTDQIAVTWTITM